MRPLALATAARACDGGPRIAIDLPSGDPKVSATITASQPQATSAIAPAILLNLRSAPLEPFPFRLNRNGALSFCFDAFSSREPVSTSLENALDCGKSQCRVPGVPNADTSPLSLVNETAQRLPRCAPVELTGQRFASLAVWVGIEAYVVDGLAGSPCHRAAADQDGEQHDGGRRRKHEVRHRPIRDHFDGSSLAASLSRKVSQRR